MFEVVSKIILGIAMAGGIGFGLLAVAQSPLGRVWRRLITRIEPYSEEDMSLAVTVSIGVGVLSLALAGGVVVVAYLLGDIII